MHKSTSFLSPNKFLTIKNTYIKKYKIKKHEDVNKIFYYKNKRGHLLFRMASFI